MLGFHGGKCRAAAFSGRTELYLVKETTLHAPKTADQKVPLAAMKSGPRLPRLERALAQKRRPNTAMDK